MCHVSILDVANLNDAFLKIPRGSNLLHYLSQPRTSQGPEKDRVFSEKFYACLSSRLTEITDFLMNTYGSPDLNYTPQDSGTVKKRLRVMANNNQAYQLASLSHPTVKDLEKFAAIEDCVGWACLFPVKMYLHHHPDAAVQYRGLLPFGGGVMDALKKTNFEHAPKGRPTYAEHVRLRDWTNAIAASRNTTTIAVNDDLYLIGMKLRQSGTDDTDGSDQ
jgi:hypothetical protein